MDLALAGRYGQPRLFPSLLSLGAPSLGSDGSQANRTLLLQDRGPLNTSTWLLIGLTNRTCLVRLRRVVIR